MNGNEEAGKKGSQFSMTRLMGIIIVAVIVGMVAYQIGKKNLPQEDATRTLRIFGLGDPKPRALADGLTDTDGDLVADAPADAGRFVDPQAILFSFVASPEAEVSEKAWQPMVEHLAKATGKPVQYVRFESAKDQLKAIKEGRLHVTAINTGNVPEAVASCGFVPAVTPAKGEGRQGYTMKIIVPADSAIKDPAGLKGNEVAFTTAGSNSGCKAPMETLLRSFNLKPGYDYHIVYSQGHEQSILGIKEGKYAAAAIASDLLEQAIAAGKISASDFKTIYTSEQFPALAIGYVYNLKPELAEKVRAALMDFNPQGTSAAGNLAEGVTGFAPVSYKDDFALVRRIDESFGHTPAPEQADPTAASQESNG
ncbi:MAG: phosphate/phosphite/phosphonate ABC transporter substrate-binding protein [Phycisphaerales bacterium]